MINYFNNHLAYSKFAHNPMNGSGPVSYILWDHDNNPQKEYKYSWSKLKAIMESWF